MRSSFSIICLLFLPYSVICNAVDLSTLASQGIYPNKDTRFCVFPFTYRNIEYNDCTTVDDNFGDVPWCSLTSDYVGYSKPCYDFRSSTLQCLPSWIMRTGVTVKTYTNCTIFSNNSPYPQCKTNNARFTFIYCINQITKRIDKSYKDRVVCDPKYAALSPEHTTCYGPSEYCVQVPFNSSEQKDMIDIHNKHRDAIPDAANMFKLYWDDELAKLAQAHSARGSFDSDQARNRLTPLFGWKHGQNIVGTSTAKSQPHIIFDIMFTDEKRKFAQGHDCQSDEGTCLHYTQLIMDRLTRVGCGRSICLYPDHADTVVVCNYLYAQYSGSYMTPYKKSDKPASGCPQNRTGNLCDCGNLACDYDSGEYLNPRTCTCHTSSCKRSVNKRDDHSDEPVNHLRKPFRLQGKDFPDSDE